MSAMRDAAAMLVLVLVALSVRVVAPAGRASLVPEARAAAPAEVSAAPDLPRTLPASAPAPQSMVSLPDGKQVAIVVLEHSGVETRFLVVAPAVPLEVPELAPPVTGATIG